jgi:hypothetical protein
MNVFVLCTGRCGSTTFAKASSHATNYTVGHETGRQRRYNLDYPADHIEVDNRLAWFSGRLDEQYPTARYVHLLRDPEAVADSFVAHGATQPTNLLAGYISAIKQGCGGDSTSEAHDMIRTINANIRHFLRDRPHHTIRIETAAKTFPKFWAAIGAGGRLDRALAEFGKRYNAR